MKSKVVSLKLVFCLSAVSLLTAFGLTQPGLMRPIRELFGKSASVAPVHAYAPSKPLDVLSLEKAGQQWVDSVFQTLTPEQKIGQFFMVATFSNRDENHYHYIETLVRDYHIGGLIFFQGGPYRQAVLTNRYQSKAKVPLLIGIDGEWGLGMRLDSAMDFPKQMTLGAIRDNEIIYQMGLEIGRQCQRLGVHINFAPVSDINSNPANPVIGIRSFGESKENVAIKASAYMRGLQANRIIATAKHFPGHGDTNADSHHTLPTISRSSEQLRDIDLFPFRKLIADSLMGVVTGHLYVPVVDNTPALAATLSEKVVTDLLKKELGFRGLVFTDALNMGGVNRSRRAVDVNMKALMAGNDILLYPENVKEAAKAILDAVQQGQISQELIDERVRKILRAKYWSGLNEYTPVDLANLDKELNSEEAEALKLELSGQAVTVVTNNKKLLPLSRLDTMKLASVAIGTGLGNIFQKTLDFYAPFHHIAYAEKLNSEADVNDIVAQVGDANVVVLSFHRMSQSAYRRYGITKASLDLVSRLKQEGKRVVVNVFGSPYSLSQFANADALVCAYEDYIEMQQIVPQVLFGALPARGVLPVSTGSWRETHGYAYDATGRLAMGAPESVGMKTSLLARIDEVMRGAIANRVVPGCQIIVARQGKIVYDRNFGALTFNSNEKVTDETMYDLASVTKVMATLQAVMMLYDRKAIDLNQKVSFYLPELRGSNKQNITIYDVLLHQAGLISYYPSLWDRTRAPGGGLKPEYYSLKPDSAHTLQVATTLWATPALKDSVWRWVIKSPLARQTDTDGKPAYIYSDLGFLTLQKLVERVSGKPLDQLVEKELYQAMGLKRVCFTPLLKLPNPRIAPTEKDTYFRNTLLVGTVHDQMAAVQGGVSGHAGLFGNAHDIAQLMQMNLQKGLYGGQRFLQSPTVPYFTQTLSTRSHRALGWDKPNPGHSSSYLSSQASLRSFGHTGFTGNVIWADPDEDLVFIFLSNRIHPTAANNSINTTALRKKIHDIIYSAISE